MKKSKKIPKEVWLEPNSRDYDDYMSLPLSQASPVAVRLPLVVHDWVKEKGAAWARNILTRAALFEMGLVEDDK